MKNSSMNKIYILALSALCVVSQLYIPIPLLGVFKNFFNLPPSKIIWISSAFGFAYAAGFLFFGPLSDRFGRRKLLIPGLFILGIVSLMIGFTDSFKLLLFLRVIQGLVAATFAPAALAYISEQLPTENRPLGIAFVSTGFMLGGILGQIYASQINFWFGWHYIFSFTGIVYIILSFIIWAFLKESNSLQNKNIESILHFYYAMITHLRNINLLKLYLCAFVLLLAFVAMYTRLGPYLQQSYYLNFTDIFFVRLAAIPAMLLGPFSGIFIKKYGSRNILLSGFFIAIIGMLGESLSTHLLFTVLMSVCFVAGVSISAPALIANISTTANSNRGAAISLYTFILFAGASLGTIIANLFADHNFKALCLTILFLLLFSILSFSFKTSRGK